MSTLLSSTLMTLMTTMMRTQRLMDSISLTRMVLKEMCLLQSQISHVPCSGPNCHMRLGRSRKRVSTRLPLIPPELANINVHTGL